MPSNGGSDSNRRLIALAFELGFIIPAAVAVGYLAGAALDRWLHTTRLTIVCVLVGVVAGFVDMIRRVLALSNDG
ncbi:MAG: AtpZ/AtpI family protein [Acidobacteria bacterium]|nr:AtpZ/AtpI family protein [Acidobacteriota bacterium]